jgi:hypothetical protein
MSYMKTDDQPLLLTILVFTWVQLKEEAMLLK